MIGLRKTGKPLELRSLRTLQWQVENVFFFWCLTPLQHVGRCSLARAGSGNPLEIVWEALAHLLLRTAATEGLQEHSSSCWTRIAFNFYFLFLMFKSVRVLPILVICHCLFGRLNLFTCGVCPLCQTALEYLLGKLLHPSPCVKIDVMMGIWEGDQITDGNWDA